MDDSSLYSVPPAGVTFALPAFDLPAELKQQVVGRLLDASWNRYPSARVGAAVDSLADALGLPSQAVSFFRGADEAIASLVRAAAPTTVLCPAFGFPGYARAAIHVGAAVVEYEPDGNLWPLAARTELHDDALVIVCWPGNPVGDVAQIEQVIELRPQFASALVDLTYLNPLSTEFATLAARLTGSGVHVAFSFSKSLSLAGVRLGGLLVPDGSAVGPVHEVTFPWDFFQVIVLDVLMDPANRRVLALHHGRQRELNARLGDRLNSLGARVLYSENPNFVSVADGLDELHRLSLDEKRYPALGLRRIDCSLKNLELVNGLLG